MEFPPPPYGGKVQEAGAQVQKTGNRAQKQLIWQSKKNPWVQHKYMQVQKNIPTGSRKHTSKSTTFFVTLGQKKNLVRSKKHVQVQKKVAQVQKACIPKKRPQKALGNISEIQISYRNVGHLETKEISTPSQFYTSPSKMA